MLEEILKYINEIKKLKYFEHIQINLYLSALNKERETYVLLASKELFLSIHKYNPNVKADIMIGVAFHVKLETTFKYAIFFKIIISNSLFLLMIFINEISQP